MLDKYSDICGISRNELVSIFKADIRELANENEMTYDEALSELQHHYDGYHFSGRGEDVYNPYSLFNTLASNEFDDYWFSAIISATFFVVPLALKNATNFLLIIKSPFLCVFFTKNRCIRFTFILHIYFKLYRFIMSNAYIEFCFMPEKH